MENDRMLEEYSSEEEMYERVGNRIVAKLAENERSKGRRRCCLILCLTAPFFLGLGVIIVLLGLTQTTLELATEVKIMENVGIVTYRSEEIDLLELKNQEEMNATGNFNKTILEKAETILKKEKMASELERSQSGQELEDVNKQLAPSSYSSNSSSDEVNLQQLYEYRKERKEELKAPRSKRKEKKWGKKSKNKMQNRHRMGSEIGLSGKSPDYYAMVRLVSSRFPGGGGVRRMMVRVDMRNPQWRLRQGTVILKTRVERHVPCADMQNMERRKSQRGAATITEPMSPGVIEQLESRRRDTPWVVDRFFVTRDGEEIWGDWLRPVMPRELWTRRYSPRFVVIKGPGVTRLDLLNITHGPMETGWNEGIYQVEHIFTWSKAAEAEWSRRLGPDDPPVINMSKEDLRVLKGQEMDKEHERK